MAGMTDSYLYTAVDFTKDVTIRVTAAGSDPGGGNTLNCKAFYSDDPGNENEKVGQCVKYVVTVAQLAAGVTVTLQTTVASMSGTTDVKLAALQGGAALGGYLEKPLGAPPVPIVLDANGDATADIGLNNGDQADDHIIGFQSV